MAAGGVHLHLRRGVGAKEPKAHQEYVQQAGVIRILDVLEHQFPVGRDELARVTQYLKLAAVENAVIERKHGGAKVCLEGLNVLGKGREHRAVTRRDLELAQAVVLRVEIVRHAALLFHAAPKRHADQVALQVIGPLVVGTHELGGVAKMLLAELHAAVGAAVLKHIDGTVFIARDHHRLVADKGALIVARIRDLGFQGHISPARAAKNALLFAFVDLRIRVSPIGHAGKPSLRPLITGKSWFVAHRVLLLHLRCIKQLRAKFKGAACDATLPRNVNQSRLPNRYNAP